LSKLRPTLWRTCRVIAQETRLRLLWAIFDGEELSVGEMGRWIGISEENASIQLRILNARGLITPRRKGVKVFYRAEANLEVEHAAELLDALRACYEKRISFENVVRMATAFTHPRRIAIVRALAESRQAPGDLRKVTRIARPSLFRHLDKLESRRFIGVHRGAYRLAAPKNPLGNCLLKIARSG